MDGLCTLYPPTRKFLTLFKWQKKKITKYFQQYVQDVVMIQAENNNISLTEFSNVSGHFMEDVNTCYGGCKHVHHKWISLSPPKLQSNLSVRTLL